MKNKFFRILDNSKHQLFIFSSKVPLPYFFALHTWIVTNKKGEINRWESGKFFKPIPKNKWGNVYKGLFKNNPLTGMNILPFQNAIRYNGKMVCYIEGNSAKKMIEIVEKKAKKYPLKKKYNLLGPNCNTFTQWMINNFPKSNLKLPINAFGKNYKIKN